MRKALVIGCVLVLANTALRANSIPFLAGGAADAATQAASKELHDQVPLGHWAYTAIAQLQATKILLGYPKAYFSGATLRSRYEFAVAINRCVVMILPFEPPPGTTPGGDTGDPSAIHADYLRLLRKLSLEFKPELIALGLDWKAADDYLHKLQDKKLHADVAEALAAISPKPTKPTVESEIFADVNRTSWVYDALNQLGPKESAFHRPFQRTLTRYEVAVAVKRCCDAFCDSEIRHSNGGPYDKAASSYDLNDVVELHKLVRSFQAELKQLGFDLKAAEATLSKAEEKRIQVEETIDTRPPTVK